MRRLFVLFLIFLLPLQVFAGVIEDRLALSHNAHGSVSTSTGPEFAASTQSIQSPVGGWHVLQLNDVAAIDSHDSQDDQDSPGDEPAEDFASHATFGDDAVPASFLIFAIHSPEFISALHNDAASIPPYLPPAARPPKI
jgi:hypothetical protein